MLKLISFLSNSFTVPNLTIPVVDSDPEFPLSIRNIAGLEPVTANINTKGYGGQDGEFFIGSHLPKRNIVITFGLNTRHGSDSVSDARNLLYAYMQPRGLVNLEFITDDHIPVRIEGFVESLTADRFSQDPEMQVSIVCPKPNFVGSEEMEISGEAAAIPSDVGFIYRGNLTTGIDFKLDTRDGLVAGSLSIENGADTSFPRELELRNLNLPVGSILFMNSRQGQKRVGHRMLPIYDPAEVNLLNSKGYGWTYLQPGINRIRVRIPGLANPLDWSFKYLEQFGGI